ncbi:MAG: FHA domain-containing protein [Caldilineaceae bacterium]
MKAYFWQHLFYRLWFYRTLPCRSFAIVQMFIFLWVLTAVEDVQAQLATPTSQPVVTIQVNGLRHDEQKNLYTISLSISSPTLIREWRLRIDEKETGKQVVDLPFNVDGRSSVIADFDGRLFTDQREYVITIFGVDHGGYQIRKPDDNNTMDEAERSILATKEFKHFLPKAEPVTAKLRSVNVDFANQLMLIEIEISNENAVRVNSYAGWILDKESGEQLHTISPSLFTSRQIQEKLPPRIATAGEREYELHLKLITKDEEEISIEPRSFKPTPPPPPGFFSRLGGNLNSSPALLTVIVIILIGVVTLLLLQNNRRAGPLLPPRPPLESPTMPGTASGRPPALRVTVIQTTHPSDKVQKVIAHFPCDLGREGCHINFPNDGLISRRHAQLTWRGGHYYLADLDSRNGTYIDGNKQPPHQPKAVTELSTIRLGKNTVIKVQPAE